jgi:hypothetical protein
MDSLRARAYKAIEKFAYIHLNAPDFPREDATTLDRELGRLRQLITHIHEHIRGDDRKRILHLALIELDQTAQLFVQGDEHAALLRLQEAEWHFREAWEGRVRRTSFVASPDGAVEPSDE